MTLIPLKCPICGGSVSRETLTCEYCGASFILSKDDTLLSKKVIVCPECGQELPEGSIVCLKCGKILSKNEKDIKKLKYLQKKLRDSQKEKRKLIPKEVDLETDEYVFSVGPGPLLGKGKAKYFIVTDKRLISYGEGELLEVKYEDIVTIHKPIFFISKSGFFSNKEKWVMAIETFDGEILFSFERDAPPEMLVSMGLDPIPSVMSDVYSNAKYALELSDEKLKDPSMIFYKLKLKE